MLDLKCIKTIFTMHLFHKYELWETLVTKWWSRAGIMKMKMVVILQCLMVMLMDWVVNRKMMMPSKVDHCLIWWNTWGSSRRLMRNLQSWWVWSESLLIVVGVADQCHIVYNYQTCIIIVSQHLCCRPQYKCAPLWINSTSVSKIFNNALSI